MASQKYECTACKECFSPDAPSDAETLPCPKCGQPARPAPAKRPARRGYGMVSAAGGGRGRSGSS